MSWFCGIGKKRKNTSKVGQASSTTNSSPLSNGRPSFTVALQDFKETVGDELTVQRGEVVEALYTDKDWIYVRNINGKCGYIPHTYCYPLEAVNGEAFQNNIDNTSQNRPRPKTLQINTAPVSHSSQGSVGVHQLQAGSDGRHSHTTSSATPNGTLSSTGSAQVQQVQVQAQITETQPRINSPQSDHLYTPIQVPPTHPKTTRTQVQTQTTDIDSPVESSTFQRGHRRRRSCPSSALIMTRTDSSYQYVPYSSRSGVRKSLSMREGPDRARPVVSRRRDSLRLADVQLNSLGQSSTEQVYHVLEREPSPAPSFAGSQYIQPQPRQRTQQYYDSSDDVFLPNKTTDNKPHGIFRCLHNYQPTFRGEVAVRRNELVIVLDYARREWAWVLTSHHEEGLVPKNLLTRYDADSAVSGLMPARMTDAWTQTELVVSGEVREVPSRNYQPRHWSGSRHGELRSPRDYVEQDDSESSPAIDHADSPPTRARRLTSVSLTSIASDIEAPRRPQRESATSFPPTEFPRPPGRLGMASNANHPPAVRRSSFPVNRGGPMRQESKPFVFTGRNSSRTSLASKNYENTGDEILAESFQGVGSHQSLAQQRRDSQPMTRLLSSTTRSVHSQSSGIGLRNIQHVDIQTSSEPTTTQEEDTSPQTVTESESDNWVFTESRGIPAQASEPMDNRPPRLAAIQAQSLGFHSSSSSDTPTNLPSPVSTNGFSSPTSASAVPLATNTEPPATPRGRQSAPVTPMTPNSRRPSRLTLSSDRNKSSSAKALSELSKGKPSLTAARDYTPKSASKNCLTLKKGDALTPQAHMHYPKGWMWVWHTGQKRFGYVPKSIIAYTYPVTKNGRRNSAKEVAV